MATANLVSADALVAAVLDAKARREKAERDEEAALDALRERLDSEGLLVEERDGITRFRSDAGTVTLVQKSIETFVDAASAIADKLLPPRLLGKVLQVSGTKLKEQVKAGHVTPEQAAMFVTGTRASEYLQVRAPKKP